jgi:hypothetical protein
MTKLSCWFAALGLLLSQTTVLRADDPRARSVFDESWAEPLALPGAVSQRPIPSEPLPAPQAIPGGQSFAPAARQFLSPPQFTLENPSVTPPVNGTWRDEGQFVVIEVNGQQLRLAKAALQQPPAAAPGAGQVQIAMGAVHGRLLQRGRPLVGCTVVIVPMHKDGATDDNGIRQPLSAITDADGFYGFANVPVGGYKLTWLPAGTTQWIRRIEMKPDVFVHEGQDVSVKDVRTAMQTIN